MVRVPYKHVDQYLHKGHGDSSSSATEWDYQLVAAVTRIRLQRYDDDFRDFMRHGALRRSYLQVYLDLFSYQPRSARCASPLSGLAMQAVAQPSILEIACMHDLASGQMQLARYCLTWHAPSPASACTNGIPGRLLTAVRYRTGCQRTLMPMACTC